MAEEKTKLAETEKKKTGAKEYSLFAQDFASVWIIVLTLCKGFGIVSLETNDIIYSGIAIAGIFMPVYFSIWLEKIRDILNPPKKKKNKEKESSNLKPTEKEMPAKSPPQEP